MHVSNQFDANNAKGMLSRQKSSELQFWKAEMGMKICLNYIWL